MAGSTETLVEKPVLIIGAGLSGLALAHALESQNIPYQLFERDRSPLFRAQGYRIRIQDFYLKQLLPAQLWAKFEKCCGDVIPGARNIDALTGKPPVVGPAAQGIKDRPKPIMTEGNTMNVDRRVLRNLMLEPLVEKEQVIFGKRFAKYEIVKDGVVAHFADGSRYEGKLLVGADGSRSLVRQQLIPDFRVLDSEIRGIFGKTEIRGELMEQVIQTTGGGLCIISDPRISEDPIKLFCDTMRFSKRMDVDVELPDDYLYWVMCLKKGGAEMSDETFMNLTREFATITSKKLTESWHPMFREIFLKQGCNEASTLAFATAHPDMKSWPSVPRVTLMGDAAHPMLPVGGVGANAAFQDAALLAKVITDGASAGDVAEYEYTMRENARQYVSKSMEGGRRTFGMKETHELKAWALWD